jgi:hypothetical protein
MAERVNRDAAALVSADTEHAVPGSEDLIAVIHH